LARRRTRRSSLCRSPPSPRRARRRALKRGDAQISILVTRAHESLRSLCDALCRVQRPIRIIRSLAWDRSVHERFLLKRGTELPQPFYPPLGFDPPKALRELQDLRKRIRGANGAEDLRRGVRHQTMSPVRPLAARGTEAFRR